MNFRLSSIHWHRSVKFRARHTHTLLTLFVSSFQLTAAELEITDVRLDSNGRLHLSHESDPNYYFILQQLQFPDVLSPAAFELGKVGNGEISVNIQGKPSGFFTLEKIPIQTALDSDGDGIDDVFELKENSYLDPLNDADAAVHLNGNPRSNLEEYRVRKLNSALRNQFGWTKRFAAGGGHFLVIRNNGSLWAWGLNKNGQLGNGTKQDTKFPVQIGSDTDWVNVSAGGSHSLGLKADGSLWAWGANGSAQLGMGENKTNDLPAPMVLNVPKGWLSVSAGISQSLGVKEDGTLWAWGLLGGAAQPKIPTQVGTNYNWRDASAGLYSLIIDQNGGLWSFPSPTSNPVQTNGLSLFPPLQMGNATNWIASAVGASHYLALNSEGRLIAWGNNAFGQLGNNSRTQREFNSPADLGTGWASTSAGLFGSAATKANGTLWRWGNDLYPFPLPGGRSTLYPVQEGTNRLWVAVGVGNAMAAIENSGAFWQFDWKANGANEFLPPRIVGVDDDWKSASTSGTHSLALKKDGTLWAWGDNSSGQLGLGKSINSTSSPTRVDSSWEEVHAGSSYSLGKKNDKLFAWGNMLKLVGSTATRTNEPSPVVVNSNIWQELASGPSAQGSEHFLAIKGITNGYRNDGSPIIIQVLHSWGSNNFGQLGDGTFTSRPNQASAARLGSQWSAVSAGRHFSQGKTTNNNFYAWGAILEMIGLGITEKEFAPVLVPSAIWPHADAQAHSMLQSLVSNSQQSMTIAHSLDVHLDGRVWGNQNENAVAVPIDGYPPSKPFSLSDSPFIIEVVDKNDVRLEKLAIATLSEPGVLYVANEVPAINVEKDSNRFYVRIPFGTALGTGFFTLSTVDPIKRSFDYSDNETTIPLRSNGLDLISPSLILVADDTDDSLHLDEIGDDEFKDRTHKICLDGTVHINSISINGVEYPGGIVLPVPSSKFLNLNVILLHPSQQTDAFQMASLRELALADLRIAAERFAQAGLKLAWSIYDKIAPDDVDLLNGLPVSEAITPEERSIMDAYATSESDDIDVFYVNRFDTQGMNRSLYGYVITDSSPALDRYKNVAFIGANRSYFTLAHEIGHILLDVDESQVDGVNLMSEGDAAFSDYVLADKRLTQKQIDKIRESRHLR